MFTNFKGKTTLSVSRLQFHADKYESLGTQSSACAWEEPASLCAPLHWHFHVLGVKLGETFLVLFLCSEDCIVRRCIYIYVCITDLS